MIEPFNCLKFDHKPLYSQKGSALFFVIIILLTASLLTGILINLKTVSDLGQLSYNHLERAYFMAEAGGSYAVARVKSDIEADGSFDDSYGIDSRTFTIDDPSGNQEGQFTIVVDDSDAVATKIYSTGKIASGISTDVQVKLTYIMPKTAGPPALDSALFTDGAMTLSKDVTVTGDVGTNGSVVIKDSGVTISGDEQTEAGKAMAVVPFSCDTCTADSSITGAQTWSAGNYAYLNFTMEANTTLTIDGDVSLYVKNDMTVGQKSTIRLLEDSSLTIYVDNSAEFGKEFAIEFDPLPNRVEDVVLYGTSNAHTIQFNQSSTFFGVVYAPQAHVDFDRLANFTGAVVADTITVDQSGSIVYDAAVEGVVIPAGTVSLGTPVRFYSN